MQKNDKIYVAGHRGLVGSAIVRRLKELGYTNLILKTRKELNLLNQKAVEKFFTKEKPDYVFLAAAKVGGIFANETQKAEFIYENLEVQNNIIVNAYRNKVKKLLFLGSSCIYPRDCPQPIKENYLLTGPLEKTNDAYAIAKIAGIVMCHSFNQQYGTNYIAIMPTNLYGQNDNFNLQTAHVLPALMRRFHEAKLNCSSTVTVWGTGKVRREFLLVDDLADAAVYIMNHYNGNEIVNIGTGIDGTIKSLAELIAKTVGYSGKILWDTDKPDGTPQKLLDVSKLKSLGWTYNYSLEDGLKKTYKWFIENYSHIRQ